MVLKKVKAGEEPGEPVDVSDEQFLSLFYRTVSSSTFCIDEQAVFWAKNGFLGSRWQVGTDMYIKVKDEEDDPFKYYTPEKKFAGYAIRSGCCSGGSCSGGSCSSGGCSGGCKH